MLVKADSSDDHIGTPMALTKLNEKYASLNKWADTVQASIHVLLSTFCASY